jgi:hypothetical protein
MMFGQFGNIDHRDSVRISHWALNGGIDFINTAGLDEVGAWVSANGAGA